MAKHSGKQKARLQYITAQLYQETGQQAEAAGAYQKVVRLNPDYRMAFNAKINAAGVFSESGDVEKTKKELQKMLRDKKNREFRDQIYYALGNIYFRERNRDLAIENYRNSVASSYNNQFQRAQSSITVADIYFDMQNYRDAQAYYDSAMIIIDNNYPNYDRLRSNTEASNLVDNIFTVERKTVCNTLHGCRCGKRGSDCPPDARGTGEAAGFGKSCASGKKRSGVLSLQPLPDRNGLRPAGGRMVFLQSANCCLRAGYFPTTLGAAETGR